MSRPKMKLAVGILAALVGVVFLVKLPGNTAQAGTDAYSSNWSAKSLLVARRNLPSNQFDQIAIGVAEWSVNGSLSNVGPYYKETWKAPEVYPVFTTNSNPNLMIDWRDVQQLNDLWLVGLVVSDQRQHYAINFEKKAISDSLVIRSSDHGKVAGKTASCFNRDNGDCIVATGAYGFTDMHDWPVSSAFEPRSQGMLMPLQWSVEGIVCDTQAECQ